MTHLYANNAAGTLAAGITNVQTTLTLSAPPTQFPSPGAGQDFYATITDAVTQTLIEIVLVTAVAGNIFTITRGQDGTTGLSWNAGDIVSQRVVAAELRGFSVGSLINVQTFTSTGTYTPTAGASKAIVRAIGGGGAGGSIPFSTATTVAVGLGGYAGAYGELFIPSGLTSQTVTVGAAGVPGAVGSNNGGAGGGTSFGTLMICAGGTGGIGAGPAGTPPFIFQFGVIGAGVTGSGNIVVSGRGADSPAAIAISAASGGFVGGKGADTLWGQGGLGAQSAQGTGFPGFGFGSGGGGGGASNNPSGFQGGAGAPGLLVVYEFS